METEATQASGQSKAPEKPDTSVAAFEARFSKGPSEQQLKRDEETRAHFEAHEKRVEEHRKVFAKTASATGNAFARQGLNSADVVKAVGLLRTGKKFEQLGPLMPEVSEKALEGWRPELERRAALPPGGERISLRPPEPKKES